MKYKEKWEDPQTDFRFRVFPHRPEPHPSVTSILSKWRWGDGGIEAWWSKLVDEHGKKGAKVIAEKVCSAASDKGTEFHALMEAYLLGKPHQVRPEWQTLYDQTIAWVKSMNIKEVIGVEVSAYHPDYVYSCQIDALVRLETGLEAWDWKTGDMRTFDKDKKCPGGYDARKFVKAGEQLAANAEAWKRCNKVDEKVICRVINPCIKTKKFETQVKYVHTDYLFRGFLLKLEAWKHENFNMLKGGFKRMGCSTVYKWPLDLILKDFYQDHIERSKACSKG